MNYELSKTEQDNEQVTLSKASIAQLVKGELKYVLLTLSVILLNAALTICAPLILGWTVDSITRNPDINQITVYSLYLLGIYSCIAVTNYLQTMLAGSIGQRILFRLRNEIFAKLQSFPIAFFNVNKSGDLISRINNDTEKLNQFFSEGMVRLGGEIFTIAGVGIFILILNWKLGLVTLTAAVLLFVVSSLMSTWIRRKNRLNLEATGNFAADIQENLNNYKVLVAFNRSDYFKHKMADSTEKTYQAAMEAGIANTISAPLYDLASKVSYLLVLLYGLFMISQGEITIGLLVSFFAYADSFYAPLREFASVYSMVQRGLAAWSRIQNILMMPSERIVVEDQGSYDKRTILQFEHVDFGYNKEQLILNDINFTFEEGKTYALVGPTGGGKSTTASVISRLYDPTEGVVKLHGRDIRSYTDEERAANIGFILQEPFIFTGTVLENLMYGNKKFENVSKDEFITLLDKQGLLTLISRFAQGVDTQVSSTDENISLGQKQLIAFMRTLLREPKLLILDEATANIDTITEEALQKIIDSLPQETTKVIIAHRLNTISKADEIIFINAGTAQKAKSFDETVELIKSSKRSS